MAKRHGEQISESSTPKSSRLQCEVKWKCNHCKSLQPPTARICPACANTTQPNADAVDIKSNTTYLKLVDFEDDELVLNWSKFECPICLLEIPACEGAILRNCLHQFCQSCLQQHIRLCEDALVKCPYRDENYACQVEIPHREVRALVGAESYERYLARSMTEAESSSAKSFHCRSTNCTGWCTYDEAVSEFLCPVCRKLNCITCQVIHEGLNCHQYQDKLMGKSETDDRESTNRMLYDMLKNGSALNCPKCKIVVMRTDGCDWVRCSVCKTEICWVTRGPRWGPGGHGDVSGGCRCRVNGIICHPNCNNCH